MTAPGEGFVTGAPYFAPVVSMTQPKEIPTSQK
jgi:hypothetical protein